MQSKVAPWQLYCNSIQDHIMNTYTVQVPYLVDAVICVARWLIWLQMYVPTCLYKLVRYVIVHSERKQGSVYLMGFAMVASAWSMPFHWTWSKSSILPQCLHRSNASKEVWEVQSVPTGAYNLMVINFQPMKWLQHSSPLSTSEQKCQTKPPLVNN